MTEIKHKDDIIKIITAFYPNAKIYLFGSFARGDARASSDIDVAIDVGKRLGIHEYMFLVNLVDALPSSRKVDLVDINRVVDETMKANIQKDGILWKG